MDSSPLRQSPSSALTDAVRAASDRLDLSQARGGDWQAEHLACLGAILPLFFKFGGNLLRNYAYREMAQAMVQERWVRQRRAAATCGEDLPAPRPVEFKTMTLKPRADRSCVLKDNTAIGQIDKIYAKGTDEKYRNSDLLASLFFQDGVWPAISFRLDADDFATYVSGKLAVAVPRLRERTEGLTRKARDSMDIVLGEIAGLDSFEVVQIDVDGLLASGRRLRLPDGVLTRLQRSRSPLLDGYREQASSSEV